MQRAEGGTRVGRPPRPLERGSAPCGGDVRHAVDRHEPLVVVVVPVEVEHVLRVAVAERVEHPRQVGLRGMETCPVGRAMAERDDEVDRRVGLGGGEHGVDLRPPGAPRRAGVRLRIGDEPHASRVEPRGVLAAAADRRRVRRRVRVGQDEPALVVPEVVLGRRFPLVVSPDRHVRRALAPAHHVVEVPVDGGLTPGVRVRQIPDHENERRRIVGDLDLRRRHRRVVERTADVADRVEDEGSCRRRPEGVVGATADRVVVPRARREPRQLHLLERACGREWRRRRRVRRRGRPVRRGRSVADVRRGTAPVERDGGLAGERVVDLVGRARRGRRPHRCPHGNDRDEDRDGADPRGAPHAARNDDLPAARLARRAPPVPGPRLQMLRACLLRLPSSKAQ